MTISSRELRRSLGFLHEVIDRGRSVEITHYGHPWAALVPWDVAAPFLAEQDWWLSRFGGAPPDESSSPDESSTPDESAASAESAQSVGSPAPGDSTATRSALSAVEFFGRMSPRERAGAFFGSGARRGPRDIDGRAHRGRQLRCSMPGRHYLVDRTVLELIERGEERALDAIAGGVSLAIAPFTFMQMASAVRSDRDLYLFQGFLSRFAFDRLELDAAVAHRALTLMELLGGFGAFSRGLLPEEALLAATALSTHRTVLTTQPDRLSQIPNLMLAVLGEDGVVPAVRPEARTDPPGAPIRPRVFRPWPRRPTRPH